MSIKLFLRLISISVFATLLPLKALGEEEFDVTRYGSFVHFQGMPKVLFFFNAIEKEDSFYFRKALRNHEIETVVLFSEGGSVYEGLQMAGIIFDKELAVYVPENAECLSACSFMFFGGSTKISAGNLGVHQFSTDEQASKTQGDISETEQISQFTVSEIVGFLNEFNTPPFVFEKMFQQKEMYYFTEEELALLETKGPKHDPDELKKIDEFLNRLDTYISEKSCDEDVNECSVEQLCDRSVSDSTWKQDQESLVYVKEAKRQGLSCNVVEINATCISDPSACADDELCSEVTLLNNGIKQWRDDAAIDQYMMEVQRRNLQCGVSSKAPSPAQLSIYVEQKDYRVGDALELTIRSTENCRLTLINIDDDKDSCVLYPSKKFGDDLLISGRSLKFPPAGRLSFSESGTETVIAICNYSNAAIEAELRNTTSVSCYSDEVEKVSEEKAEAVILETLVLDVDKDFQSINDIPNSEPSKLPIGNILRSQISLKVSE